MGSTSNGTKLVEAVSVCCTPRHEEWSQHYGHKGDSKVTLGTCGVISERAQVILVWVRALSIENA